MRRNNNADFLTSLKTKYGSWFYPDDDSFLGAIGTVTCRHLNKLELLKCDSDALMVLSCDKDSPEPRM